MMDRRLTVFSPVTTQNGSGDVSTSWIQTGTLDAQLVQQASREFRSALATQSETEFVFRTRYTSRVRSTSRLSFEGIELRVLGDPVEDVAPGRGRRQWMLIRAARIQGA